MQDYQLRVVEEAKELDEKIGRLSDLLKMELFNKLDIEEQRRMERQLGAMAVYAKILHERIAAFSQ